MDFITCLISSVITLLVVTTALAFLFDHKRGIEMFKRVGIVTVRQFEAGLNEPRRATLEVIKRALEAAGIEFIQENGGGPGVRLQKRQRARRRGAQG